MTNISHMRRNIHTEVREKLIEILGDSLDNVDGEELIDFAVDNVFETSGIEGQ